MNTLLLLALLASPSPNNRYNQNIVGTAMDRDAAATPLSYVGKAPLNTYANTNTAGGDINLTPASGLVKITGVTAAGVAADVITVIFRKIGVSAATTVTLTEGVSFACAAVTDAECVANFVTAFNANAGLTGYLLAVYVAASETASIGVVDGMTASITSIVSSDAANFVTTQGANGCVKVGGFYSYLHANGSVYLGATCTAGSSSIVTGTVTANSLTSLSSVSAISTITSSSATTIGWSKVSAANQACTTTCTNACVFGQDTATMAITDCADATSDVCTCAGAN